MKQENFIVECIINQADTLFVVRVPNGAVVKYTHDVRELSGFFDDVAVRNLDKGSN